MYIITLYALGSYTLYSCQSTNHFPKSINRKWIATANALRAIAANRLEPDFNFYIDFSIEKCAEFRRKGLIMH